MKRGLRFLLFSDAFQVLALGMLAPIYAIFVQKIGGDILDASWGYFTFMFTTGIVIYLISHWEDKIKHKEKLVTLGYVLTALGCLAYFFVSNQFQLLVAQVILGVAEAVQVPAYDGLYSRFIDHDRESSEWGDWEAMKYITTAVAALVGGYFANQFGFKALFVFMFISAFCSTLISLNLFRAKEYLNER